MQNESRNISNLFVIPAKPGIQERGFQRSLWTSACTGVTSKTWMLRELFHIRLLGRYDVFLTQTTATRCRSFRIRIHQTDTGPVLRFKQVNLASGQNMVKL